MIFSPLQTIRRLLMKVEISNGWLTADVRTTSQLSLLHNFFNKFKNEIFWINICFCFCSLVSLKAGRLINGILETKVALVLVYNDGVFEINHYWWQITTRRPIASAQPWGWTWQTRGRLLPRLVGDRRMLSLVSSFHCGQSGTESLASVSCQSATFPSLGVAQPLLWSNHISSPHILIC